MKHKYKIGQLLYTLDKQTGQIKCMRLIGIKSYPDSTEYTLAYLGKEIKINGIEMQSNWKDSPKKLLKNYSYFYLANIVLKFGKATDILSQNIKLKQDLKTHKKYFAFKKVIIAKEGSELYKALLVLLGDY